MSLELKNVSKTFAGKKVVDNVSFSLEKPGVYGLLGTNGAGKTTTIRMLLGIINKDMAGTLVPANFHIKNSKDTVSVKFDLFC